MSSVSLQRALTCLFKNLLYRIAYVTQLPVTYMLYICNNDDDEKDVLDTLCTMHCTLCILFFYISGLAVEIEAGELVGKLDDGGYRQIRIDSIREIRLDRKINGQGGRGNAYY